MSDGPTDAMYDGLWWDYRAFYRTAVAHGMFAEAAGILRVAMKDIPRRNLPRNINAMLAECEQAAQKTPGTKEDRI